MMVDNEEYTNLIEVVIEVVIEVDEDSEEENLNATD